MALTLIASACASPQSGPPVAAPKPTPTPTAPPPGDPAPRDLLFHATLTGASTTFNAGKRQTDTAAASVDVTFKAIGGDIALLQVQGGTVSLSDATAGQCQGSGRFAGLIQPTGSDLDRITPTTGDGIGDLILNDGGDGLSTGAGAPRTAISFLINLSVAFKISCPALGVIPGGGVTVRSCIGNRSTSTTFILMNTAPGVFAGTCHDDIRLENITGTLDWTGQAQQISP
jgi:hypothetical protein